MMRRSIPSYHPVFFFLILLAVLILGGCAGAESTGPATRETTTVVPESGAADTPETPPAETEEPPTAESQADDEDEAPARPLEAPATATPPPTVAGVPTDLPFPTATPTSAPQFAPNLGITEPQPIREGISTPATAIPTAVPRYSVPEGTTNVLLLGSDAPVGDAGVKRTDTMIIVSINRDGPTASMVSLPRDLYVYIPGGTMNRLNAAITVGGVDLLKQTILYNFGIPIHYYARVDFEGFEDIVDSIGGVDLAVSCGFRDWKIRSPDLDPEDEENWYVHELEPGIHHMDGETALWYARSRLLSNDFDRGRRQQQLLRGMLDQGVDLNLIAQVPELWATFQDTVDTDMDIGRMLQIAALAPAIRDNGVQNLYLFGKTETWTVPDSNAQVQLPVWEGPGKMSETFQRLFLPPALNKANRAPIEVEVINASGNPDMATLAAENLAWYGFVPVINEEETAVEETTTLDYYAPNFKGSYDWLISWVFHLGQDDINLIEDEAYAYDYKAVLGEDYDPCLNEMFAPQAFLP